LRRRDIFAAASSRWAYPRARLLAGLAWETAPRDLLHLIDPIYRQEGGLLPEAIISDTGSYGHIVFALMRLVGFDYRPSSPASLTPGCGVSTRPRTTGR
jgi:hypothetical protein